MQNQSHNHNVLDTSRIGSLLLKLSAPMFLGMTTQNIYQIVDTIFVGRYVGSNGLAALSIMLPIQMLVWGTSNMVGVGGASLISRLIGEREQLRAERALGNSIFFALAFSAIITLAVVPFSSFWLRFIGASESVMPYAQTYLTITISGTFFNLTGMTLLAMARAEGNARVSMISMLLQSILNIILDAVLMIVLKMGIAGAALATVISQAVALIYVLTYYFTGSSYLKIRWRNLLLDMKIVKDILAIGVSQFLRAIAESISGFLLVRMVSNYGGDVGLSAFSIIQRLLTFSSIPSNVLAQAMQPVLGFNYGARRFRLALKTIYMVIIISTSLGVLFLLLLVINPVPIIKIFTGDPGLIAAATTAARITLLALPLFGFFNVGQLVFPSIGKALPTFIISVLRPLAFMVPLTLILSRFFQLNGVWMIFPGTDTLAFFLTLGFLIPLIRKFREDIKTQENPDRVIKVTQPQLDTDAPIV